MQKATLVRWSARLAILAVLVSLGCLVYFFPQIAVTFGCVLFLLLYASFVAINIATSVGFGDRHILKILGQEDWKSGLEIRDELRRTNILYRLRILDSGNMYMRLADLKDRGFVQSRKCERYTPPPGGQRLTEYRLTADGIRWMTP